MTELKNTAAWGEAIEMDVSEYIEHHRKIAEQIFLDTANDRLRNFICREGEVIYVGE